MDDGHKQIVALIEGLQKRCKKPNKLCNNSHIPLAKAEQDPNTLHCLCSVVLTFACLIPLTFDPVNQDANGCRWNYKCLIQGFVAVFISISIGIYRRQQQHQKLYKKNKIMKEKMGISPHLYLDGKIN